MSGKSRVGAKGAGGPPRKARCTLHSPLAGHAFGEEPAAQGPHRTKLAVPPEDRPHGLGFVRVDDQPPGLRVVGIRTSKERVRRLMREHDLQAPHRGGSAHGPKAHDGTITTAAPDVMWGTDMTATVTVGEGTACSWPSITARASASVFMRPNAETASTPWSQSARASANASAVSATALYRPRVLGQWFDGIRFYAAASRPTWGTVVATARVVSRGSSRIIPEYPGLKLWVMPSTAQADASCPYCKKGVFRREYYVIS